MINRIKAPIHQKDPKDNPEKPMVDWAGFGPAASSLQGDPTSHFKLCFSNMFAAVKNKIRKRLSAAASEINHPRFDMPVVVIFKASTE